MQRSKCWKARLLIMKVIKAVFFLSLMFITLACTQKTSKKDVAGYKADSLLAEMTLDEKIGQLVQKNAGGFNDSLIREGGLGSVLNLVDINEINRLQRVAVEQSRLGIPLIFARDVIHGFKTIFPIPLGQAASWNPALVQEGTEISATEARSSGIRWTFAPMIDVTRDPRWGRIAESYGEDPYLSSTLGAAAIKGYQGNDLKNKNSIAACAKHFAAYGAAEAGRDYHTVTLPENELRDVYLPPFKAAVDAKAATFMTAFNEISGVPASGHDVLLQQILRNEWGYQGMVVSDWFSVQQMVVHGYAEDNRDAAIKAINAGVDMEMASPCYEDHLKELIESKVISMESIDRSVRNVLRMKFEMGLFENPYSDASLYPALVNNNHRQSAKEMAKESIVLLKNKDQLLPLSTNISSLAIIGPLADQAHDQLGTWIFDGDKQHSITPLTSFTKFLGSKRVNFASGMAISRTMDKKGFAAAIDAAKKSDAVVLFIGEESILSGESHCRADINLPGLQTELIEALSKTGKPIVAVVMAGRPLTFENEAAHLDAILYAWHPGTMAGPAIKDIVFGFDAPSGKLPVTFPRTVGQIPVYYSQKNSGKPATAETWEPMNDIPHEAFQLSVGNTNHFMDYGFEPWYSFGFGLSYTNFDYSNINVKQNEYHLGDSIEFTATLANTGNYKGAEVVQLYIRDLVGSRTRPVKELKGFKKIMLNPGESKDLCFRVHTNQLGFHNQDMNYVTEPGAFKAGIGGNSDVELTVDFTVNK